MRVAERGVGKLGIGNAYRVVVVCHGAQDERLAAEHVAALAGDSGVTIEQPASLLCRRSFRRRVSRQICNHRHLGRRVLLIRRLDALYQAPQKRLRRWLEGAQCRAELQVLTYRLPSSAGPPEERVERIDQILKPDLLIFLSSPESLTVCRSTHSAVYG